MSEYINLCLDCGCGCARMGHSCGHPGEHRMCANEGRLIAKNEVKDEHVHVIGGRCDCYMSPDYYAQWNGLCTIPNGRCYHRLEKYETESEENKDDYFVGIDLANGSDFTSEGNAKTVNKTEGGECGNRE